MKALLSVLLISSVKGQQGLEVDIIGDDFDRVQVSVNGLPWMAERDGISDVLLHKDKQLYSRANRSLIASPRAPISGRDVLGSFSGYEWTWLPVDTFFATSYRLYDTKDILVFGQEFSNTDQDIEGTQVSSLLDRAINEISTIFPSLVVDLDNKRKGFWTFGGRMAGTPCISIGELKNTTYTIRDGTYGGPVILFNEAGDEVVIMSPLNNFMATNLYHRENENPMTENHPGAIEFGLLGSIKSIPAPGIKLEFVLVFGSSFDSAFKKWGQVLLDYGGKQADITKESLVADYLGYWTDNGGFYYYNTMEEKNYEETLLDVYDDFQARKIPARYLEIDSWWYLKDELLAVKEWEPLPDIFPNGLVNFYNQTGWPIVAHNRYWSRNNVYDVHNNGSFHFIREVFAIPTEVEFWNYLFGRAKEWGLFVYNQDWQDFQVSLMTATVTDINVSRDWLRTMDLGAQNNDVEIQYCMTLPKELMQSSELPSVTRVRTSEDYLIIQDQWRIGLTAHFTSALGVKPFKDVFWTSQTNPGNNFYYDCMEIDLETDPNSPWPLNYRYVGPISKTASGYDCIPWADLDMHWTYPLGDLARNGCRNPFGHGNGKPMCYYEADLNTPQSEWKWENCDIPVCEADCTRDMDLVNDTMPYCKEFVEPNPELQAVVSTLSMGGVAFGDAIDNIDMNVLEKVVREDGKIMGVDYPAVSAPAQILEMAFGGIHKPQDPIALDVGEIWSSFSLISNYEFNLVFVAGNRISRPLKMSEIGLKLNEGETYLLTSWSNLSLATVVTKDSELTLPQQSEFEFDLLYFSPILRATQSGRNFAIVGDASKYVPFSSKRIKDIQFDGQILKVSAEGPRFYLLLRTPFPDDDQDFFQFDCPGSLSDIITFNIDTDAMDLLACDLNGKKIHKPQS